MLVYFDDAPLAVDGSSGAPPEGADSDASVSPSSGAPRASGASSTPGPSSPLGATMIGRYALLRTLGEGGMGVVFAAFDEKCDKVA